MRIGIVEAIAALSLVACGGTPAPAPAPNCSEWVWAFETRGSDNIRPGTTKTLTLTSLRMRPGQFPTDQGVCDDHATNVTWESSDPTAVLVSPTPPRSATVFALRPGTSSITARFLADGVPMSTSIQITVLPAIAVAAPAVPSGFSGAS
jgi:hypothetical protein